MTRRILPAAPCRGQARRDERYASRD